MPTFNWSSILPLNWISGDIDKEIEEIYDEDLNEESEESAAS